MKIDFFANAVILDTTASSLVFLYVVLIDRVLMLPAAMRRQAPSVLSKATFSAKVIKGPRVCCAASLLDLIG